MPEPRFVFDATADNFRTPVLANSEKEPVAVNFWSLRAGPCRMLMPRLFKLAEEFDGWFLLVRLNTDEYGRLARDWGVTGIPTTKVFRRGRVVDTLHDAESETSVRAPAQACRRRIRLLARGGAAGVRGRRRRTRGGAHGAGRDGLPAVLDLPGEGDPRASYYRAVLDEIPTRAAE